MGFFHILHEVYTWKQEVVVIKIPEWKLKAKLARNTIFEGNRDEIFWSFCVKNSKRWLFLEVFTLVSQSLCNILGNNIASVSLQDWKLKFCLRNYILEPFSGQNVGPDWVKNDKKRYFHTSYLTPNPVFPKKEVLKSYSLLTH